MPPLFRSRDITPQSVCFAQVLPGKQILTMKAAPWTQAVETGVQSHKLHFD